MIEDKEDKKIIAAFEKGEMRSVPNLKSEIKRMQKIAQNHLKKNSRISLRLSSADLQMIKMEAVRKGLPYQSFIASVLHQFVTGQLKSD